MNIVGDDARNITKVDASSIADSELRERAVNQTAPVIAGWASVHFDPDGYKTVYGFVCNGIGYIADPLTKTILERPNTPTLANLFNHYARGDG